MADPVEVKGTSKAYGLSLRRNFSWNLVGNIVYAACQWGILVVLAKLTSPEMVGRFALGLAVTAPIIMLSQLSLRGIQATDAKDEYTVGHYLGLRMITTALALIIIAGVVWAGRYPLASALVIIAVGLAKAFESVSDVCYGLMQRHERMDRIAKSLMLKGPLSLAAMGLLVFLTGEVFWGVIALGATWGVLLLTYDLRTAARTLREFRAFPGGGKSTASVMSPEFNIRPLLKLLRLAMPLGIVMALLSLQTNIPRYFIENDLGVAELGIFVSLAYLVMSGTIIVSAMGQSFLPRLSKYYVAGDVERYKKLLMRMIGVGLVLGLGGVLVALAAGRPILTILYRPEYADRAQVLVWLMVAGGLSYVASFLGYGMTAARHFDVQLPLSMIVAVATYVASLWLIPDLKLKGAACALMTGALVQIVGSGLVVAHALKKQVARETP